MSSIFEKQFETGWRDMDPNGHMANSAYLEFAVNTRIAFFASAGFAATDFQKRGFGPVIKSDFTEYFRELRLLEKFRVTMERGGIASDGSRFRIVNNFYKEDGTHSARVVSIGGWLGFAERKLIEPPEIMKTAINSLSRTEDFEELKSSIKK
jgi:acyl-CoA thioester hydrolase